MSVLSVVDHLITVRISNRSHTESATIRQFAANQLEIMSEYRGPLPPERTCGTECVERASVCIRVRNGQDNGRGSKR